MRRVDDEHATSRGDAVGAHLARGPAGDGRLGRHERLYPLRGHAAGGSRHRRRSVHAMPRRRGSRDEAPHLPRPRRLDQGRPLRADPEGRAAALPAGVPRWGDPSREDERPSLRRRAQPLLVVGMGRGRRAAAVGRAARVVVPHARQGQELLARPRRAAGAGPTDRRRVPGDRGVGPDLGGDAGGGGAARRPVPSRPRAHPARAARRRPSDVHAARSTRGARPPLPEGAASGAVRRSPATAQGARHRDPHDRRGGGARSRDGARPAAGDRRRSQRFGSRRGRAADGPRRWRWASPIG